MRYIRSVGGEDEIEANFSVLQGEIITLINSVGDTIEFITQSGKKILLFHDQNCCENVYIEEINGDLNDLLNTPILLAEERTSRDRLEIEEVYQEDSFTWTFYTLATIKGYVTIRWFGSSNGYYSEEVTIRITKPTVYYLG